MIENLPDVNVLSDTVILVDLGYLVLSQYIFRYFVWRLLSLRSSV